MQGPNGERLAVQTKILDRWSDGSARWVLCDWQGEAGDYRIGIDESAISTTPHTVKVHSQVNGVRIDTGKTTFEIDTTDGFSLRSLLQPTGSDEVAWTSRFHLCIIDRDKSRLENRSIECKPKVLGFIVEESGPLRATICINCELLVENRAIARAIMRCHFFAGSSVVRHHLTLTNHHKAGHPGGLWDLGNEGSLYIRSWNVSFTPGILSVKSRLRFSTEVGKPWEESELPCKIEQHSSGGENWQSSNHLNRHHTVPMLFRGYRTTGSNRDESGLRATPIMELDRESIKIAVGMPAFWQNFPKSIEESNEAIVLGLFPTESNGEHELQGGEQKTEIYYACFGDDTITTNPLEWTREPLIPVVDPEWIASTKAIGYFTPRKEDPHFSYLKLVDAAIEGEDSFVAKRERIDEYGWRHFGELYGDHEAVFHQGPNPLISHYNNQYDAVAGFGYQYLRSGDVRWFSLMKELAQHVIDIDIYHTDEDKAAYNHGLFWHTYHYVDADTGTHRSYPRNGRIPPHGKPVPGGGPANEQNYATGLTLYYFMTGDPMAKETAIDLAQWVIDMDDGKNTKFRFLASGDTGLASSSREPNYHGPGRGAANSITVLLDGYQLTQDRKYLIKAEQLIRRCVHPNDNIDRLLTIESNGRKLVDAENRWFYTMFLQSLGQYLDRKNELAKHDIHEAYARESLIHYAKWMVNCETPYLQYPEILEYPTETWAAQDMRKSEVFMFASLYATVDDRVAFEERAEFFFQTSIQSLSQMKTRTLCRPVVLMLSFGWRRTWFLQNRTATKAKQIAEKFDFGQPQQFIPQKTRAIKRFKQLVIVGGIVSLAGLALLIKFLLR